MANIVDKDRMDNEKVEKNQPTELTAEQIYEQVAVSVVEITGVASSGTSVGSGFFCDEKGTVITNYHVIEKCSSATITLSDGKIYDVKQVLGFDVDRDIAILSTTCAASVPVKIRRTAVKTGEAVYAIGSSLGLSGSLSNGIVSAAEREVEGNVYIQTTAPISHGNSGGPLLDKEGAVVGITTASFVDGQNLNLAIPICEIDKISTETPLPLNQLFSRTVEWLSEYDFFYYEDDASFVLLFELADEDKVPMAASGAAKIKIVNGDGVTVYEEMRLFETADFGEWTYNGTEEKYLASIYIDPDEITKGASSEGKVYFTIFGLGYSFEETTLNAYDLPIKPFEIQLPKLPANVNYLSYDGSIYTTTKVTGIQYEIVYGNSLCISFSGEKVYDCDGETATNSCYFRWKLYDSDGYLIDDGMVSRYGLQVGDKFKGEEAYVFDCIEPGESYKIVVVDDD